MPRRGTTDEPPEPWASFLREIDHRLKGRVDLHCIGGFAITMQFGLSRETSDIDILAAVPSRAEITLQELAGKGSELHRKLKVYLQLVKVTTYPEEYEGRLVQMWPQFGLEKLHLYVLEAHDLALTKLERNSDVDRQDMLWLAGAGLIDAKTLRDRYVKEFRPNFVGRVETCDGTIDLWTEMIREEQGRRSS
jgi:hypothetical protein